VSVALFFSKELKDISGKVPGPRPLFLVMESARLADAEPRAYLREATLRTVRNPGSITLAGELKQPDS